MIDIKSKKCIKCNAKHPTSSSQMKHKYYIANHVN
jgi:hypothetical protein